MLIFILQIALACGRDKPDSLDGHSRAKTKEFFFIIIILNFNFFAVIGKFAAGDMK